MSNTGQVDEILASRGVTYDVTSDGYGDDVLGLLNGGSDD